MRCRDLLMLTVLLLPATDRSPSAADDPPSASTSDPLMRSFAGVWLTDIAMEKSKWFPDGGRFSVQEVTQPVLKGRLLLGRETSQPDGRKSLWLLTHDAERNVYPFWMFDSSGLGGGEWELSWDASTHTAQGRAIDTPTGWTSSAKNHIPDGAKNVVDYWMKDETGALLVQAHGEKRRQKDEAGAAFLASWSQSVRSTDRPEALALLEPLIGVWDAVTVIHPAVWTPAEQQVTSVVTREWVLNDRFVLDRSVHSNGQESLALLGYDARAGEYRGWWFNSEGHRNTSRGTWSGSGQMFTSRAELPDGKVVRSMLNRIGPDREEWQFVVTDAGGTVYFSSTIQTTRRAGGGETAGVDTSAAFDGMWELTTFERDGQAAPLQSRTLWIQTGGRFTIRRGDDVLAAGTSRLDPTVTPKAVDVTYTAGPDKGRTFKGIYEVNGETVRFCRAGSPEGPRPVAFRSRPGSGEFVAVYRRAQP